jgi:outer membrane receptor protein involved in Fe transport
MQAGSSTAQRPSIARSLMKISLFTLSLIVGVGLQAVAENTLLETGRAHGRVTDKVSGEPLLGVTVALAGTKLGAFSDLQGYFEIKGIPSGSYTLVATSVGYDTATVTPFVIKANEAVELSLQLSSVLIEVQGMTVTGRAVKNTEATVIKNRQKASEVQDVISAQDISRSGSGDAADAARRVVGASVVDGRYVYVRGLGGRYTNTQLNGSPLPSPDPDKQSVPMDLVPANMLDNIVVFKSFTPDKPGDFAGGSMNLSTRDFPEHRSLTFSTGTSYNSNATGKSDVLTYHGGSSDWAAADDGTRDVPSYLSDPQYSTPSPITATKDSTLAARLDRDTKAITSSMQPTRYKAPLNQAYAMTYGETRQLFGRSLGLSASFSYNRSASFYKGGNLSQWVPSYVTGSGYKLDSLYQYRDEAGKDEVLWGGLAHAAYSLSDNHKISLTYVNNRNGESTARYVSGWNYNLGDGASYRTRSLLYSERRLSSEQMRGEHHDLPLGSHAEWQFADSRSTQDEPDLRYFSDNATAIEGTSDSAYGIYQVYPAHYFRYITERNRSGQIDLTVPFKQWAGLPAKLKLGGSFLHKTREFREREFTMNMPRVNPSTNRTYQPVYTGNPDAWLSDANTGIVADTSRTDTYVDLGVTWSAFSDPAANYNAAQDVAGSYGMVELPLMTRLQLVGGVRYETTKMTLDQIYRATDTTDLVDGNDLLPALSLVYHPTERMNVRAAFGRTLARPSFRELASYASWEFIGGSFVMGNPDLKYTKIDNYDLRWEWFQRPGELVAVSVFYKRFQDPIERVILNTNYDISWENVDNGTVLGLEVEMRQRLDQIHPLLSNFRVGGNFSLIRSRVKLSEVELIGERALDSNASDERQLQGQSPYLVNSDITYDNDRSGTSFSVLYNRFGKRLSEVSLWANPDIFEVPRTTIDATLLQRIWGSLTFKASAKNLTDSDVRKVYDFNGKEYLAQEYSIGRTFGIGMTYQL